MSLNEATVRKIHEFTHVARPKIYSVLFWPDKINSKSQFSSGVCIITMILILCVIINYKQLPHSKKIFSNNLIN